MAKPLSRTLFFLGGIALLASVAAIAQNPLAKAGLIDPLAAPKSKFQVPTSQDRLFLNSALQDNLIQIKIAQLALQASSNPNVLQLAQLIVADRTSMAQQTANTPPASAAKKMKASLAKFQPLTGEAFDEAFLKQVIKDDKTSLNDYKIEVAKGADTLIASWADRGAFIMARHLKIAEQISQSGAPVVSTNTPARPAR